MRKRRRVEAFIFGGLHALIRAASPPPPPPMHDQNRWVESSTRRVYNRAAFGQDIVV